MPVTQRKLQVMARDCLVYREILNRIQVVFAQEGGDLRVGPVGRQRRHRVKSFLILVERPRRAEIGQRDAALKLGHHDDLDGFLRHRDDVLLDDEVARLLQVLPRDVDNPVSRRQLLVGHLEGCTDDCLLVSLVGIVGECRVGIYADVHLLCNVVHLAADEFIFLLGKRPDLPAAERRIQCIRELPIVEFGANAEIAIRPRQQLILEPRLVFGDRGPRGLDCRFEPRPVFRGKLGHVRDDHRVDDRCEATVLLDRGLGVNLGNASRLQRTPRLREEARQLREPRCRVVETLFERCKVA